VSRYKPGDVVAVRTEIDRCWPGQPEDDEHGVVVWIDGHVDALAPLNHIAPWLSAEQHAALMAVVSCALDLLMYIDTADERPVGGVIQIGHPHPIDAQRAALAQWRALKEDVK